MTANLNELVTEYLEYLEIERGRSHRTVRNYWLYMKRFMEFAGEISPQDIDGSLVRKYRLMLNSHECGLSMMTQSYHLIALRGFLSYLAKRDVVSYSPDKIELPKVSRRQVTFLSYDEVISIIDVIPKETAVGLRDRAIIELLFSCGLRVSELVGLDRSNVNTKRREFTVRGKGQKDRPVFLGMRAAEKIEQYLKYRDDDLKPLLISYRRGDQEDDDDRRLSVRAVQKLVAKYAKMAGITKHVGPHTLRHSFATDLLINGADIRSVQSMLGHSSITTTQAYTHITDKQLREVHEKFHRDTR